MRPSQYSPSGSRVQTNEPFVDIAEPFDAARRAFVRWLLWAAESAQSTGECPLDRRREVDVVTTRPHRRSVHATVTSVILASVHVCAYERRVACKHASLAVQRQLNGGRRSRRREPAPARRHTRAIQSASSSVTRLAITRTAMFIRNSDRIAIGPVAGRKRGNVSSSASRRATENPLRVVLLQERRPRRRQITRSRASPPPAGRSPARSRCPRR